MKIGNILPIGRLDKYGYQYFYKDIVKNHTSFFDEVVVVSNSKYCDPDFFNNQEKATLISSPKTWFTENHGQEAFSFTKIVENLNRGLAHLKKKGFDVAMSVHINQYIPMESREGLLNLCREMVAQKRLFEWVYKKYQLVDILFNADTRVPWILNLTIENPYLFYTDSIINSKNKESVKIESGDFSKYNRCSIVDVFGELTMNDQREKYELTVRELNRLRSEWNIDPARHDKQTFDCRKFMDYYQHKMDKKTISKDPLDEFGRIISSRSQPDFISHALKRAYRPIRPNMLARLMFQAKKNVLRYISDEKH